MSSETNPVILIAGLGNPGREYRDTRHNVGFMLVDVLAEKLGVRMTRVQSQAIIGQGNHAGCRVILAKPQTYMNLSGRSVSALMRFYKIAKENLLVAHDDLDLPVGTLRLRPGGGSAGQRGVASIIEQLGTQDFARLRIGIGRPPGQKDPKDYVLEAFPGEEWDVMRQTLVRAAEASLVFVEFGLDKAMNQFNAPLAGNGK